MEEQVELRVPFAESYVPVGRRKPRQAAFWSALPISIRRIAAADLEPAYRIHPPERRSSKIDPYVVRRFHNSLWWPITIDGVAVTPSRFRQLALQGHRELLDALGVETFNIVHGSRETYYADCAYREIKADTRNRQWMLAQRGAAERILFCGNEVLIDAGEPIHYFGSFVDFVGPAHSNRCVDLSSRGDNREWIAHRGAAYGVEEVMRRYADDRTLVEHAWRLEQIEILVERHRIDAAAVACARAMVRHLLWKAHRPSAAGRLLRQR